MRTSLLLSLFRVACSHTPSPEAAPDAAPHENATIASTTSEAPVAAQILLVRFSGAGLGEAAAVNAKILNTSVLVDRDKAINDTFPFLVRCYDATGNAIFQTSRREPLQIREFLGQIKIGLDPFVAATRRRHDLARPPTPWRANHAFA